MHLGIASIGSHKIFFTIIITAVDADLYVFGTVIYTLFLVNLDKMAHLFKFMVVTISMAM